MITSLLLKLICNHTEGIHNIICKYRHDNDKIREESAVKYKFCECCLEYTNVKHDFLN